MKVALAMRSKAIVPGLSVCAPIRITFGSKQLLTVPIDNSINPRLSHQRYKLPR
jgi:hypothetical protein